MYRLVYFDISGVCNAQCHWCVTENRVKDPAGSKRFITPATFEKALDRLKELGYLEEETRIDLFNWGEPLLHPEIDAIFSILDRRNINFGISTNASKVIYPTKGSLKKMKTAVISMPGFSQESYDRVHGFKFENILENIDQLKENFIKAGFRGEMKIAFHLYQFNINEVEKASDFCRKRRISFTPTPAFFNSYANTKAFLEKRLDYETLDKASRELLLYYVDEHVSSQLPGFQCSLMNIPVIDEQCNLLTCCALSKNDKDQVIGSLFELTPSKIEEFARNRKVCEGCVESGTAYWLNNPYLPDFVEPIEQKNIVDALKQMTPSPVKKALKDFLKKTDEIQRK